MLYVKTLYVWCVCFFVFQEFIVIEIVHTLVHIYVEIKCSGIQQIVLIT